MIGRVAEASQAGPVDVLFVCVRNAGRSQMAKALFNALAAQRGLPFRAESAGTMPARQVHPEVVVVMRELGIDLSSQRPRLLTNEMVSNARKVVTMGCAVDASACPAMFLREVEDWGLPDPEGRDIEEVRAIRDMVRQKVEALIGTLAPASWRSA